jgi:Beta-ketoacyl synthase, N-terminal domain
MTRLAIAGIGVCATGMPDWARARQVLLAREQLPLTPLPRLAPECLPPLERRRANATTRLAISAAAQAVAGLPSDDVSRLPTIFSTSDGDGEVLASMLAALAQPQVVLSPTLFHNSVFNAPAGYWSIGAGAHAASVTVSAGAASFVAGLKEAHGQVQSTGAPVLYIAFDAPFPAALASFARSAEPFACALRLQPDGGGLGQIELSPTGPGHSESAAVTATELLDRFRGNASAAALPLLLAIARQRPARLALPNLDGAQAWLDYLP